jgi:hypothetical protein
MGESGYGQEGQITGERSQIFAHLLRRSELRDVFL